MRVGMPFASALQSMGALAYPPTPTTASGRNSFMILPALQTLLSTLNGTDRLAAVSLLCSPATGRPIIL